MERDCILKLEAVSAGYAGQDVLRNFRLCLKQGEICALVGPSGCGKSTLLKVLCGILPPSGGKIRYLADAENGLNIGYVPQSYGLLPWKTIRKNIMLPLKLRGIERNNKEILDIIHTLDLQSLLHRYPKDLSGGQKQRAALARAFVSKPDLLLMDEPFSALDALSSEASQRLFLRLWKKYKVTTLFITHNMQEAAALGARILLMDDRSGQIRMELDNPAFGAGDDADALAFTLRLKEKFGEILS